MTSSKQQEMVDRALARAVESYRVYRENRLKRSIKVIDPPKIQSERPSTVSKRVKNYTCQAILMSGLPCKYKATSSCGCFCRKHNIN